ncbi:MAG: DNA topoisomerase IB [Leptolyngbyaceae cyanobacterium SL_7_1]|nr:DNA topoisomerase IB [Leptolyngbyaceae cyanobacterium SL_7_1]
MATPAQPISKRRSRNRQQTQVNLTIITDPLQSAERAGLHYVAADGPGIRRQRSGRGFCYLDADGNKVCDRQILLRIKALIIPPAWENVWICPSPTGHLQATGYDAKGRKQYRYHADWHAHRGQTKFNRMIPFGLVLPKIRQQTDEHLRLHDLCREKVLATVVQLLEKTLIRVGNDEYAIKNKSFGLTTMRDRHVKVSRGAVQFQFRGKSGVKHAITLDDRRLARVVKQCRDIPGQDLFQYFDEVGQRQTLGSGDVNDYLRTITGEDFTAKDFRTWAGTVQTAIELTAIGDFSSQTAAKKNITQAIKTVAARLGNRPATCRKYYVHPAILDAYTQGALLPPMAQAQSRDVSDSYSLNPEEQAVLTLLEQSL